MDKKERHALLCEMSAACYALGSLATAFDTMQRTELTPIFVKTTFTESDKSMLGIGVSFRKYSR